MAEKILRQKLPPNMRSDFWNDLIDAIEEESKLVKEHIALKKNIYNVDKMDYNRLLEIADLLNIPFNVSVINTEDFLRSEIKSIPFRIKNKSTPKLYKSFFQAIERQGQLYLYYWDGSELIRDSYNLLNNISDVDPSKPYVHLSKMQFSSFLSEATLLDTGLKLDAGWKLDNLTSRQNTKHLGMEIILDRIFFQSTKGLAPSITLSPSLSLAPADQEKYLINPNYFSYIETNLEISKKVTEVLHVGCQLTAIMDNSRYFNSLRHNYTMPDLLLNAVTTNNMASVSNVSNIAYMAFGTGSITNLPNIITGIGVQPTSLHTKLARVQISNNEKWENPNYIGVSGKYIGCLVNDITIGTGNGTTSSFNFSLPYFPIKPGNVKISFTSGMSKYTIEDDYYGNLSSANGIGTLNYTTGAGSIETNFFNKASTILGNGTGSTTSYSGTIQGAPLQASSIFISYIISGTTVVAQDNGSGAINGPQCTGTINYTTGVWTLTFSTAPANGTQIIANYKKRITNVPDNGTPIEIEYYFLDDSVEITEAGLYDINRNLLAYATFPKINFNTFNNHLSMNFILKKTNF